MTATELHNESAVRLFKHTFNRMPEWHSVAPGRVNLIGEHTDYNLLPVLPMPLDECIHFWLAENSDGVVRLVNADERHGAVEIDLSCDIEPVPGHWSNYCRAAIKTVRDFYPEVSLKGFDAVIHSTLPEAAGLSSSSALVIGTCLSLLRVDDRDWPMRDVAERMRLAEQFVGTAGGGMDQAVIALGLPDSALLIEFDPLEVTAVSIPPELNIYVINSGQKAEKTGAARYGYNRRALECAIGVQLLQRHAACSGPKPDWQSLRDFYAHCQITGVPWETLVLEAIPSDHVTEAYLEQALGREVLAELCRVRKLNLEDVSQWLPDGIFQVFPRVTHVLNETDRVYAFRDAMQTGNLQAIYYNASESHASLRDLYHVSTPEIEQLVQQTVQCGAGAARITGAGFGGCIVAFVPQVRAEEFLQNMADLGVELRNIIHAKSAGAARIEHLAG